ncbi:hypothetical protein Tco_1444943 [Tanacetum coccineum]
MVRIGCVWLPLYRLQICLVAALQIADVFGFAWFRMILPDYTSALQIADVFSCRVCFTDCRCIWFCSDLYAPVRIASD